MGERVRSHIRSRPALWEWIKAGRPRNARHADRAGICPSRWHELRATVEATGPLRVDRVDLPGTEVTLRMTRPYPVITDSTDTVPYWAEIWPSGVVLAGVIAREPGLLHGRRVLELGPGVGVTAVAALQAGADLVVADSAPGSLAFCAFNAFDHVAMEPQPVLVNWRQPSPALFAVAGAGFSLVLAADALYEERDVKPLLTLVERLVAPGGELWLAEPGRVPAERFVKAMRKRGWLGADEQYTSPVPDPHDRAIDVVTVTRLRRPSAASE